MLLVIVVILGVVVVLIIGNVLSMLFLGCCRYVVMLCVMGFSSCIFVLVVWMEV